MIMIRIFSKSDVKTTYEGCLHVSSGACARKVTSQNPESTYEALKTYGTDLTSMAREGKLDPVIGRDDEIRRVTSEDLDNLT